MAERAGADFDYVQLAERRLLVMREIDIILARSRECMVSSHALLLKVMDDDKAVWRPKDAAPPKSDA